MVNLESKFGNMYMYRLLYIELKMYGEPLNLLLSTHFSLSVNKYNIHGTNIQMSMQLKIK